MTIDTRPTKPSTNYFLRHWHGELSLPVSYWINGSVVTFLTVIAIHLITESIDFTQSHQSAALVILALWASIMSITVWQLVGIWRSAGHYSAANPSKSWGRVAKIFAVLGGLQFVVVLFTQALPQMGEYWQIANGSDRMGDYKLRVIRDGTELELSGNFGFGLSRDVETYLDNYPDVWLIHLNSNGGRVVEARRLAEIIEQRKLSTYTAIGCYSACILPFAAGKERLIAPRAKLGFHQYASPGMRQEDFRLEYQGDKNYLLSKHINADFVAKIFDTPNTEFWEPSHAELLKAHYITRYPEADEVALSGIAPQHFDQLEDELRNVPLYAALETHEPDTYAQIIGAIKEGFSKGKSLSELRAVTMPVIQDLYMKRLPYASGTAILEFTQIMIEELKALQNQNPVFCYHFVFAAEDSGDVLKYLPESLVKSELAVAADVIKTASTQQQIPTEAMVDSDMMQVVEALSNLYGEDVRLLGETTHAAADQPKMCRIAITLYEKTVALPKENAVALLRYMFAQP